MQKSESEVNGRFELSVRVAEEELGCWMHGRDLGHENEEHLEELRQAVTEGKTGCVQVTQLIKDSLGFAGCEVSE